MSDKDLAAEISAEIDHLAAQLVELDLLGEDNRGTPGCRRTNASCVPTPGPGRSKSSTAS
jgi:hypothetical protein